jgi:hypothetical protein
MFLPEIPLLPFAPKSKKEKTLTLSLNASTAYLFATTMMNASTHDVSV